MEESIYMVNKFASDLERYTRKSLLKFICRESEEKGATIFGDAHIFDYLARWDTHEVCASLCGVPCSPLKKASVAKYLPPK